jgi:1-deoxy-D-xylulose-5-phosphate reductoisomerase
LGITRVAIAGSTGSIGTQTLDYISQSDGQFEVVALGVGTSAQAVIAQAKQWNPKVVAVADESARKEVAQALPGVEVVADQSELAELADVVVNGVVGFAGL